MRSATVIVLFTIIGLLGSCSDDDSTERRACLDAPGGEPVEPAATDATDTLVLLAHDSFAVSPGVLETFTEQTGIDVEVRTLGDTGQLVSEAVLTAGEPLGDVLFGVDNTFLCRALEASVFEPLALDLTAIDPTLDLDPHHRVVPVDFGDVCLNTSGAEPAPASFRDLVDPEYAGELVTQDPETSSPGLAFLLATIAVLGDGWRDYWAGLVANDVEISPDWTTAYFVEFAASGGDRSIVTSYATSPVAEVLFSDPPVSEPSTSVVVDSCFRQVEMAGVLRGTEHPEAAAALVEFLVSPTFQADVALSMFVYPARTDVELPPEFAVAPTIEDPITMDPVTIHENRDAWTSEWREIVLG